MRWLVIALWCSAVHAIHILDRPPTSEELQQRWRTTPLLIRNALASSSSSSSIVIITPSEWTLPSLKERFQGVDFRQGAAPYPPGIVQLDNSSADDHDHHLEIFQFGTLPATFALGDDLCLPVFAMRYGFAAHLHDSAQVACELLRGVRVPPFVRQSAPLIPLGGLIIGGTNATTIKHQHYSAINILVHGAKLWEMDDSDDTFVQHAGDIVYIPENVPHAVRNLQPSTAWTFQFHDQHLGTQAGVPETQAILSRHVPK